MEFEKVLQLKRPKKRFLEVEQEDSLCLSTENIDNKELFIFKIPPDLIDPSSLVDQKICLKGSKQKKLKIDGKKLSIRLSPFNCYKSLFLGDTPRSGRPSKLVCAPRRAVHNVEVFSKPLLKSCDGGVTAKETARIEPPSDLRERTFFCAGGYGNIEFNHPSPEKNFVKIEDESDRNLEETSYHEDGKKREGKEKKKTKKAKLEGHCVDENPVEQDSLNASVVLLDDSSSQSNCKKKKRKRTIQIEDLEESFEAVTRPKKRSKIKKETEEETRDDMSFIDSSSSFVDVTDTGRIKKRVKKERIDNSYSLTDEVDADFIKKRVKKERTENRCSLTNEVYTSPSKKKVKKEKIEESCAEGEERPKNTPNEHVMFQYADTSFGQKKIKKSKERRKDESVEEEKYRESSNVMGDSESERAYFEIGKQKKKRKSKEGGEESRLLEESFEKVKRKIKKERN